MKKKVNSHKKKIKINKKLIRNVIIAIIAVALLAIVLQVIPNWKKDSTKNKVNLVINNNNVTAKMKKDVYIDDKGVIYLAKEDVQNYLDKYIYYDKENNKLITTSDAKTAILTPGQKKMEVNGSDMTLLNGILEQDNTMYLPFSEMSKEVYNMDLTYIEDTKTVVVDSIDRELVKAETRKNTKVKNKASAFSSTVDNIKKADKIVVVSENNGWTKIRTEKGKVGYIKSKNVVNQNTIRQAMEDTSRINGKVNLVWDYYSEYKKAPDRSGTQIEGVNVVSPAFFSFKKDGNGQILDNAGEQGKQYIKWAHDNGYKVWPIFSNNSMLKTTSEILNNFQKRQQLIDAIIQLAETYEVDGINLDFENMKEEDKDVYSRLVVELAPRLKDTGKTLSVDVTAPDGAGTWSLCFDRNVIGNVADYLIFMAYDQYGISSAKEGTTAGYNWVETNINKFLGQEDVKAEKIILGMPFYTRLWKEENGKVTSKTVDMKEVDNTLPTEAQRNWDDELKQYFVEYKQDNATYKMWIEDKRSIQEKIGLANKYQLAGIAFWEKDREPDDIWTMINETLQK